MKLIKRRASTKEMVTSKNFEEVKAQFLLDIKAVVGFKEIPFDLTDTAIGRDKLCSNGITDDGEGRI